MPIIPVVGRKAIKMRLLVLSIYVALAVLGVGMVYPFLMTLTASVSGPMEYERYAPVPRSLWSREDRFVGGLPHYFPERMRNGMQMFALAFDGVRDTWTTWKSVGDDEDALDKFAKSYLSAASVPARYAQIKRQAADYDSFATTYPLSDCICSFDEALVGPYFRDRYQAMTAQESDSGTQEERGLKRMSRDWGIPLDTFYAFSADREFQAPWDQPNFLPYSDGRAKSFGWMWQAYRDREFLPAAVRAKFTSALGQGTVAPMCETRPYPMKLAWLRFLGSDDMRTRLRIGGGGPLTIAEFNRAFGTTYRHLRETPFPIDGPGPARPAELVRCWSEFAQDEYPRRMIEVRLTPGLDRSYRAFVNDRCLGSL